jgi:hypothetical protein
MCYNFPGHLRKKLTADSWQLTAKELNGISDLPYKKLQHRLPVLFRQIVIDIFTTIGNPDK